MVSLGLGSVVEVRTKMDLGPARVEVGDLLVVVAQQELAKLVCWSNSDWGLEELNQATAKIQVWWQNQEVWWLKCSEEAMASLLQKILEVRVPRQAKSANPLF